MSGPLTFNEWFEKVKDMLLVSGYFTRRDVADHEMSAYADDLRELFDTGYTPGEAASDWESEPS